MKASDLTDSKVAELKQQHGDELETYTFPNGEVAVFKPPSPFAWGRFVRDVATEKDKSEPMELLAIACAVVPGEPELRALFKKYTAAPLSINDVITKLGGGGGDTKKL